VKIVLFKTNIDIIKDKDIIAGLLDNEKRIMKWELLNEPGFTVLSVLYSGLISNEIEKKISALGFECEVWID